MDCSLSHTSDGENVIITKIEWQRSSTNPCTTSAADPESAACPQNKPHRDPLPLLQHVPQKCRIRRECVCVCSFEAILILFILSGQPCVHQACCLAVWLPSCCVCACLWTWVCLFGYCVLVLVCVWGGTHAHLFVHISVAAAEHAWVCVCVRVSSDASHTDKVHPPDW